MVIVIIIIIIGVSDFGAGRQSFEIVTVFQNRMLFRADDAFYRIDSSFVNTITEMIDQLGHSLLQGISKQAAIILKPTHTGRWTYHVWHK